jgi:hypothetical protein
MDQFAGIHGHHDFGCRGIGQNEARVLRRNSGIEQVPIGAVNFIQEFGVTPRQFRAAGDRGGRDRGKALPVRNVALALLRLGREPEPYPLMGAGAAAPLDPES